MIKKTPYSKFAQGPQNPKPNLFWRACTNILVGGMLISLTQILSFELSLLYEATTLYF